MSGRRTTGCTSRTARCLRTTRRRTTISSTPGSPIANLTPIGPTVATGSGAGINGYTALLQPRRRRAVALQPDGERRHVHQLRRPGVRPVARRPREGARPARRLGMGDQQRRQRERSRQRDDRPLSVERGGPSGAPGGPPCDRAATADRLTPWRRRSQTSSRRSSPGPAASDYERYLRTDELLALQKGPDEWAHRDELLFQTVHQSSELWLKHAWVEVEEATRLDRGARPRGRELVCCGARPRALKIRRGLPRASRADVAVGVPGGPAGARSWLGLRLAGLPRDPPRLAAAATTRSRASRRERGLSLLEVYVHGREHEDLYQLAELLTEWDERVGVWRFRHFKVVAPDHRRGRRRHAGNAGRAACRPDQEQDVPRALARAHRADRAGAKQIRIDLARRDSPRPRAARRRGHAHAARPPRCSTHRARSG